MPAPQDPAEQSRRSLDALSRLIERVTPWLVDVGSWVFGGLIALNLVIVAALITVGPVDRSVVVGVAAFAGALPLDVAGVVLLRFVKDVEDIRIDDVTLQAFKEATFRISSRTFRHGVNARASDDAGRASRSRTRRRSP